MELVTLYIIVTCHKISVHSFLLSISCTVSVPNFCLLFSSFVISRLEIWLAGFSFNACLNNKQRRPWSDCSETFRNSLSLHCLSRHFPPVTSVQNFRTFTFSYVPLGLVGHIHGMQINKGPYSPDFLQAPLPGNLAPRLCNFFHAQLS